MNFPMEPLPTEKPPTEDRHRAFFRIFTQISKAIHSGESSDDILRHIAAHVQELLDAKGCIYWIVDRDRGAIVGKHSQGFSYRSLEEMDYATLAELFPRSEERLACVEDARNDPRIPDRERLGKRRVGSISALFFGITASLEGILAVYFYDQRQLSAEQVELVTALGEQGAIALQKAMSFDEKMIANMRQMVEGLAMALEAKDEQTHGHSVRVAALARMVAVEMGLSDGEAETIHHGGMLHDIGKIGMEDAILQRLGILNKKELDIVRRHPEIGARITKPLNVLSNLEPLILHHHERFDGSGYPKGLRGRDIPLGARILAVCDAFETMLAGRRHLAAMSLNDAAANLSKESGRHFDPKVVRALFSGLMKSPEVLGLSEEGRRIIARHREEVRFVANFGEGAFF
jgi:putative nucleotidyltransferase with HDIG domain